MGPYLPKGLQPLIRQLCKVTWVNVEKICLIYLITIAAPIAFAQDYTIAALGAPNSVANAINNKGQVVGVSNNHAFRWTPPELNQGTPLMEDIGTLGGSTSEARDINEVGQIVGRSQNAQKQQQGFVWINGTMVPKGGPGGNAYGINSESVNGDAGSVSGQVANNATGDRYAFVWLSGGGSLRPNGTTFGAAFDLNDKRQIVGYTETSNGVQKAFRYTNGLEIIPELAGYNACTARRINEAGEVAGYCQSTGANAKPAQAFYWSSATGTVQLPHLGGRQAWALDINEMGEMIGWSEFDGTGARHAVLWKKNEEGAYEAFDLNAFLPAESGWVLTSANGINDDGQIVGGGTKEGTSYAFLLKPDCKVSPITSLTDREAIEFENGRILNIDRLNTELKSAMACLYAAVQTYENTGAKLVITSAYRPPSYQAHLKAVFDKWQQLKDNTEAICQERKQEVWEEMTNHELTKTKIVAGPDGPHTRGDAFDFSVDQLNLPLNEFDRLARNCGLYRPHPEGSKKPDPVHVQLLPARSRPP